VGSFLLEPRSLVCFQGDMYHDYLHGIEQVQEDELSSKRILNFTTNGLKRTEKMTRETRISVTIRFFPKILNVGLRLGRRWYYYIPPSLGALPPILCCIIVI